MVLGTGPPLHLNDGPTNSELHDPSVVMGYVGLTIASYDPNHPETELNSLAMQLPHQNLKVHGCESAY